MKFNDTDMLYLRGTCGDRFVAIPEGCPARMVATIAEIRAKKLNYQPSQVAEPVSSDLRDKLAAVSLL